MSELMSKCCDRPITVSEHDHGRWGITHYYVCSKCKGACDPIEEEEKEDEGNDRD